MVSLDDDGFQWKVDCYRCPLFELRDTEFAANAVAEGHVHKADVTRIKKLNVGDAPHD